MTSFGVDDVFAYNYFSSLCMKWLQNNNLKTKFKEALNKL